MNCLTFQKGEPVLLPMKSWFTQCVSSTSLSILLCIRVQLSYSRALLPWHPLCLARCLPWLQTDTSPSLLQMSYIARRESPANVRSCDQWFPLPSRIYMPYVWPWDKTLQETYQNPALSKLPNSAVVWICQNTATMDPDKDMWPRTCLSALCMDRLHGPSRYAVYLLQDLWVIHLFQLLP